MNLKSFIEKKALELHPDRFEHRKDIDLEAKHKEMALFNAASDIILDALKKKKSFPKAPKPKSNDEDNVGEQEQVNRQHQKANVPEWAWAGYSGGYPPSASIYKQDYIDYNYFKKRMWELSGKSKQEWTIWAFDGHFFRGVITVFGNNSIFKEMAEAMVIWNSRGGNPYRTCAVVAIPNNTSNFHLIYLNGKLIHELYYGNSANPGNDKTFTSYLKEKCKNK